MGACGGLYTLLPPSLLAGNVPSPPLTGGRRALLLCFCFANGQKKEHCVNTNMKDLSCTWDTKQDVTMASHMGYPMNQGFYMIFSRSRQVHLPHISASIAERRLCGHTRYLTDTLGPPPIYNGNEYCIHS